MYFVIRWSDENGDDRAAVIEAETRIRAEYFAVKRDIPAVTIYEAEPDDIREAPALALISDLLEADATVVGYDPAAIENVREGGLRLELATDLYAAAVRANALALVTEWKQFRGADLRRLKSAMAEPILFDGRNVWDPEQARELGFEYSAIGRGTLR